MTFEVGRKYYDAIGRRWKVVEIRYHGELGDLMIVKRRFKVEIALSETDRKTAIVLLDQGFTTIYDEEAEG